MTRVTLTDEQARVVAHDKGPALVFAVAGAGKTTTMVRRIERLVRENVFRPERILATSFGKANVDDLKRALKPYPHTAKVQVKTLHALAYGMLRDAMRLNRLPEQKLPENIDDGAQLILNGALTLARNSDFRRELDTLDRQDFLDYVGAQKSVLAFLPGRYRRLKGTMATEVDSDPHIPWYYDLYELFEQVRLERKLLTFDDFVPEAWALLVQNPDLAERYQKMFDTVIVDEYQDVNLGQVELLDILVRNHKNYVAIGDDDQAIYGFRGASNSFIMGFQKRYGATTYTISDNFRCHAEHALLANHVIQRNKVRAPKTLTAAKGFGGTATLTSHEDNETMGKAVAENIERAIDRGLRPDQIAILVRLYAETASIEAALIERGIAYRISGSVPFFERTENVLLLQFLELGLIEARMDKRKLTAEDKGRLSSIWWDVLRTPKRYLRREASDTLLRQVLSGSKPSDVLLSSSGVSTYSDDKLIELGETLAWVVDAITEGQTGSMILMQLEQRLDYKAYLIDNSGFVETGQSKAQNVEAFLDYAKGKGDAQGLLETVARAREAHRNTKGVSVGFYSIFKAKGLEWPYVIVPSVNYGHIPAGRDSNDLAEERRLFYVALTRTQRDLELHVVKARPPSIFMEGLQKLVELGPKLETVLAKRPSNWSAAEALELVQAYPYLERYCRVWLEQNEGGVQELEAWMIAANDALALKTTPPLPRPLVQVLKARQKVDTVKLETCAKAAGTAHKVGSAPTAARHVAPQFRALTHGARVRHRVHGQGWVTFTGSENGRNVVEVAFDKGRTAKFVLELAKLEII
jgi:DNA helicase-2/ATP-dependent DNA helicase PcrA